MNNMVNKAQGFGLSILTKIAGSEVLDQLKLRKFVEKSLYQSSKAGFKTLSQTTSNCPNLRMHDNKNLHLPDAVLEYFQI